MLGTSKFSEDGGAGQLRPAELTSRHPLRGENAHGLMIMGVARESALQSHRVGSSRATVVPTLATRTPSIGLEFPRGHRRRVLKHPFKPTSMHRAPFHSLCRYIIPVHGRKLLFGISVVSKLGLLGAGLGLMK